MSNKNNNENKTPVNNPESNSGNRFLNKVRDISLSVLKQIKKVLVMFGRYLQGVGKDIVRSIQDNPSIVWALLLAVPGVFIGLFLNSHIRASYSLTNEYRFSGIMMFTMLLSGCLNMALAFSVKGKRNLRSSVYVTIITAIIVASGTYWVSCLFICDNVWVSLYKDDAVVSIICTIISMVCPTVGCIGSYFTRNKNYKKDTL